MCDAKADVVFLYDDSGSISNNSPANFGLMKTFMKDVVGKFTKFGPDGMQFSAVCFSKDVHEHFPLNKYATKTNILDGITSDINPSSGTMTRIGAGLEVNYHKQNIHTFYI